MGVWGGAPSRRASGGYHSLKTFWNSLCDLVHFDAIWWQLFVGHETRYIYNFAIKIEPICQLQCPHDCTAVLPLLSNEHALKSGTFGVKGLVLLGRGTTMHKSGTFGKSGMGGNPNYMTGELLVIPAKAFARDYGITGVRLSVCLSVTTITK